MGKKRGRKVGCSRKKHLPSWFKVNQIKLRIHKTVIKTQERGAAFAETESQNNLNPS